MADVTFNSERANKVWSIATAHEHVHPVVRKYILFLHAWTGCDTTSGIYLKGKKSLAEKIQSSE